MQRRTRYSLIAATALALAACGDDGGAATTDGGSTDTTTATAASPTGGAAAGGTTEIAIADFAFAPTEVEVAVGDEIVWINEDGFAHTATIRNGDGSFDTGNLDGGQTSDPVSFDAPGTYEYICGIHNSMRGTVVVS